MMGDVLKMHDVNRIGRKDFLKRTITIAKSNAVTLVYSNKVTEWEKLFAAELHAENKLEFMFSKRTVCSEKHFRKNCYQLKRASKTTTTMKQCYLCGRLLQEKSFERHPQSKPFLFKKRLKSDL